MRTLSERTADQAAIVEAGMNAMAKEIRVAIPGIVEAWDKDTQTVSVRCAIRERIRNDENISEMEIPMLVDVPVVFPSAGGYSFLACPAKGDECLVIFADMCIDAWWQNGSVQSQMEYRRHDLSDGFAIMGCWSQPNLRKKFPTEGCVMQNASGTAGISIRGGTVNLFGTVQINGQTYDGHKHTGVTAGNSKTGGVDVG